MAKQKERLPSLSTLIEEIKMASHMAGTPVLEKDMAEELRISQTHFSSLKGWDRDGKKLPRNIGDTIRKLQRIYKKYLPDDVRITPDLEKTIEWLIKEAIRDRTERAFLMAREKERMTPAEWKKAQAIIAQDEAHQLAELKAKGSVS